MPLGPLPQQDLNHDKEQDVKLNLELSLDHQTIETFSACKVAEFPICLDNALDGTFVAKGRKPLDSIIMNKTFGNATIGSRDICRLYEKYIEQVASILGNDVAQVINFESLKQLETMSCRDCPSHKAVVGRKENSICAE